MKSVKLLMILLLVAFVFMGCSKPQPLPPETGTSSPGTDIAASPAATESPAGGEKETAQAYVDEWVVVEGDVDTLQKEWDEIVKGADKMTKEDLAKKIEEHSKKHDDLKTKVQGLKADSDDTKAHQGVVVEVLEIQMTGHNAFKDKNTKEGVSEADKTKFDEEIKKCEEDVKTKLEDAKKKIEDLVTKHELKKTEGTKEEGKTEEGKTEEGKSEEGKTEEGKTE